MTGGTTLTSAAGVLSLLDEADDTLKVHALRQLNKMVDHYWAEIASSIHKIEALCDQEDFKSRDLASVVASKVYYHLEELREALNYALGAGDLFDVNDRSEYVETLIAKCIDEYIVQRVHQEESKDKDSGKAAAIDPRLVQVVERMFDRCFEHGEYKQALGIAIETRRLDIVSRAIKQSGDVSDMLQYCFGLAQRVVQSREFRRQMLRTLIDLYAALAVPDYLSMCQCLLFLDDHAAVARILETLITSDNENNVLMAYQVAFDLHENQNSPFLVRVSSQLPQPAAEGEAAAKADRLTKLKGILSGEIPTDLSLHFLFGHNHTDLNILNSIKDKLEQRNSVTHNATVIAHSIMHCGTTVDTFLRTNLEWLGRANNWAKFTAAASIGVIHRGHVKQSLSLLDPYLPKAGNAGSPYQEGGALYALGLIHANHGGDKLQYLLDALRAANNNEILQHGACLGIGLSAMSTASPTVFEQLKNIVYTDSAVAGEAAGYALGLLMLGTGDASAIEDMMTYARETKHEKIIRGLAMGIALILYAREEEADPVIAQLLADKDPILRYGGVFAIALAYVGTGHNPGVKKLLHIAVSDVSDDVRRGAVMALGFVLSNNPVQVPRIVSLLSESFNSHVRYGSCFAVGIACAGTGLKEAMDLLEPLTKDRVDYVRQAAFISLAMVLMQVNANKEPRVAAFRESIMEVLKRKADTMAKLGAILAAGILDAGGRNMTISLLSPGGHKRMAAVVGMALFPQFWYWYPLAHMISLALTPTAVIGLNKDLKIPQDFKFTSQAKPSLFAYPPAIELKKEEKRKKVPTAQLSVTAKAKAKAKAKARRDESEPSGMDIDTHDEADKKDDSKSEASPSPAPSPTAAAGAAAGAGAAASPAATDDKKEEKAGEEKKAEEKTGPEPDFEVLSNPARVTPLQQSAITFDAKQRYQPLKPKLSGFVLLVNTAPNEPEALVQQSEPKIGVPGVSDDEPGPPAPFQLPRFQN